MPSLRLLQILLLAPVAFAGGTVGGGAAWALPHDALMQLTPGFNGGPFLADLVSGAFAMALLVLSSAQIATLLKRATASA
jgi:hypothetical protein